MSGHQLGCCLVCFHFLSEILNTSPLQPCSPFGPQIASVAASFSTRSCDRGTSAGPSPTRPRPQQRMASEWTLCEWRSEDWFIFHGQYRVAHLVVHLGLVDMEFECLAVLLSKQAIHVRFQQAWAEFDRFSKASIPCQLNQGAWPDETPCVNAVNFR